MLRKTSLNTSLLMSVFLVAMVCSITAGEVIHVDVDANLVEYAGSLWSFTTVGGEAQPDYPEDGAVILGDVYSENLYTELIFVPGATAVKHTGYFSDDYSKVYNRHQDANLGPPPYSDPRSECHNDVTYYAGLPLDFWDPMWDNCFFVIIPTAGLESLERGQVYYWTVDETDPFGNVFPADVWDFAVQPYNAFIPSPPNEAIYIDTDVLLSWFEGYGAAEHDVYLGTSWEDVNNAYFKFSNPLDEYQDTTGTGVLEWQCSGLPTDTKIYWRIDEVQGRMPPNPGTIYKGDVWCFTTVPHRIFVDVDANGANDGTSWEDAYNYLQDALADASSSAEPVEIRIAEGIYTPDSNSADPNGSGDRTATFKLIDGVTLKGGYAGYGEPDPNACDIEVYETILSGDLDSNDVDVNDPADLLDEPTRAENSYHVVYSYQNDANAVLDGFTITGGDANGLPGEEHQGGGMYNYWSTPMVANCTFSGNTAGLGGGMLNNGSSPIVTNCNFIGNSTSSDGGGMFNFRGSPKVTNCHFSGNSSGNNGGGMGNFESYPFVINCILWGDTPDEIFEIGSSLTLTYSDVQGGTGKRWFGTGCIDADPCFVDTNGGNLRLSSDSPCIDVGDNSAPNLPATDMDGHPRIIDGDCNDTEVVDMGAYEFNYAYIGDFDYQCDVDLTDFSIFGLAWMTKPGDAQWNRFCDISKPSDNYIDWRDAVIVCDNWLAEIP